MLTTGTQGVHGLRDTLARDVFERRSGQVRVITRDVGGGFGTKAFLYREYPLVLEAARRLGRPVKWVGDRAEHFLTDAHGRDNLVHARWRWTRTDASWRSGSTSSPIIGAYSSQFGPMIP